MSNFSKQLDIGKTGESLIAQWLKSRGNNILPVYEIGENQYKGPAVYASTGENVIAPDMLVFGGGKTIWIEAKHKSAFSFHRITKQWVTGIDIHHYNQYLHINTLHDWPVWLLFLQSDGRAKDSPEGGPTGLYGNDLSHLSRHENHRHNNWGKTGMVYWSERHLKKMASYPLQIKGD